MTTTECANIQRQFAADPQRVNPRKEPIMADKQKKPFRLFEQWGGDDKYFRLAQQIVMWVALVAIAYIIWG